MTSEMQFVRGFKRLMADDDAETFREFRIRELDSIPGLVQCYNAGLRRVGIGLRIPPGEVPPDVLPPDSNKAIVSVAEIESKGALMILTRPDRCAEATFLGIARGIANHFSKKGDHTSAGFIAAIEEWIPESKQPPPFTYKKQAGLMGELFVLEHDLLPHFSKRQSVAWWKGPTGNAKDFVLPSCCIEVKATKANDDHSFWVSNEDQFLVPETRPMFLRFISFSEDQSNSETVAQAIERVRNQLVSESAVERDFMRLVKKAGYNPRHRRKYELARFTRVADFCFEVTEVFPRLLLENVQKALKAQFLAGIKYAISVDSLRKEFEIKPPARRYWQPLKGR